jgi:maltose alpha-D-glucosyltransferase/alpha-amylase
MAEPLLDSEIAAAQQSVTAPPDDPLWYRDAVVYQLNVKAFFDSDGDGYGDFKGVTSRLDYVKELGVNTIWLMPFYPSPLKDDGYDISRYDDVHPQYGTLDDFREMLGAAHERGLKVITELVINHTSDQHPWFQAARRAPPGSPERDFYVWSDTDQKYLGTRIIFTDTETSNWTGIRSPRRSSGIASSPPARPELRQPEGAGGGVRTRCASGSTWASTGSASTRFPTSSSATARRTRTCPRRTPSSRSCVRRSTPSTRTGSCSAEANMWPEDVREYFGDGDECHMAYHFPLMPRMYMAIAQEDRYPIVEIMQQTPEIPEGCQWAIFLRNHDELTLEMVTSKERDYMYNMYAADQRARINLGIRRRLAPLMENDIDRVKLMNGMLLSMPGSPIIYYGDEIGMGDNVFVGDRNGVRTPMQWSPDRNAGFSRADPQRLYLQPIMDPMYGYEALNVEAQSRDASSLLSWTKRMLAVRKTSHAFGRGKRNFIKPGNRKILAYLSEYEDDTILTVFNLSRAAQPVELDLSAYRGRVPVEMLGRTAFPPIGELPYLLTLPSYGFYWFRLSADTAAPAWHQEGIALHDRPTLVLFDGWTSFFRERVMPWRIGLAERMRAQLETDTLPRFVEIQRWYAAKGTPVVRARRRRPCDLGGRRLELDAADPRDRGSGRAVDVFPAARPRLGGAGRGADERAAARRHCQGAQAGQRRRHGGRLLRRGVLPGARQCDRRRPHPGERGRPGCCSSDRRVSRPRHRRRRTAGVAAQHGEQQHDRDLRRDALPERATGACAPASTPSSRWAAS